MAWACTRAPRHGVTRPMVFYIDAGNPTNMPKVVNPHSRGVPHTELTQTHFARGRNETVWSWGPDVGHMWKIWYDRDDTIWSLLGNVHAQTANAGTAWYQGQSITPNACTVHPKRCSRTPVGGWHRWPNTGDVPKSYGACLFYADTLVW